MISVRRNHLTRLAVIALGALLLSAAGGLLAIRSAVHSDTSSSTVTTAASTDRLTSAIGQAQRRLRLVPGDYVTWAALGSAYLERARVTADASYYPKADGALHRSLALHPTDNVAAVTGLGALANARHDFAGARALARQALRGDPYAANAYGVLADAETQLGHAAAATDAVQHMLDLQPGLAALSRASYDLEQHGRVAGAQALMRRALAAAVDPADRAFCRYQVGELAWHSGQLDNADRQYAVGLAADPTYLPLREGRAKVAAAHGHVEAAVADYAALTATYPAPGYFVEYAELLRALGRHAQADAQLALADAAQKLFTANGGTDDLTAATVALTQGRPAQALRLARQEWQRRQHAEVADILAWALHHNGRDGEALGYARRAGALGARNARYAYHLGMIQLGLGERAAARRDLARALAVNPYFSPLDAPRAAAALARLRTP